MNKETRYMVKSYTMTDIDNFCHIDKRGILWIANTGRKSIQRNPSVFKTKKEILEAIKVTTEYAKKNNYDWQYATYKIISVTILKP